jgi:hypothetical protein
MKFIEVKCENREAEISINIDHIVLIKKMVVAGSGKNGCEIVVTATNDNKGPVLVINSVSEIKKRISSAK